MQVAEDFLVECSTVEDLAASLAPADFARKTAFKGWTIDAILRHLHVWNKAAYWSLTDEAKFETYLAAVMPALARSELTDFEERFLDGLSGPELFDTWRGFYPTLAAAFGKVDPKQRVRWAGPDMSARSSMTARLMESWAHAQAIFDELGVDRRSSDGIENIVVLGFNTYGWTFANRGMTPPEPRPHLRLVSPSGAEWLLGDPTVAESIVGSAEEFCQVVTQTRNVADTSLEVTGRNAGEWMRFAQCFAGPPNDPPAPGTRFSQSAR